MLQKNTAKDGTVSGTGQCSITYSKDGKEMFCVYHGRTTKTGNERVVFIDRMEVKGGKIKVLAALPRHKNLHQEVNNHLSLLSI